MGKEWEIIRDTDPCLSRGKDNAEVTGPRIAIKDKEPKN